MTKTTKPTTQEMIDMVDEALCLHDFDLWEKENTISCKKCGETLPIVREGLNLQMFWDKRKTK